MAQPSGALNTITEHPRACCCSLSLPTQQCRKRRFSCIWEKCTEVFEWDLCLSSQMNYCLWIDFCFAMDPPVSSSAAKWNGGDSDYLSQCVIVRNGGHQGNTAYISLTPLFSLIDLSVELGSVESLSISLANMHFLVLFPIFLSTVLGQFCTQRGWDFRRDHQWSPSWAESNGCAKRYEGGNRIAQGLGEWRWTACTYPGVTVTVRMWWHCHIFEDDLLPNLVFKSGRIKIEKQS